MLFCSKSLQLILPGNEPNNQGEIAYCPGKNWKMG